MDFGDILRRSARHHAERVAIRCDTSELTYAELYARASALAAGLVAAGARPGDRIATVGDNALDTAEQLCAFALGGFVRCPLYTHNASDTHAYMLNLSGARIVLAEDQYVQTILECRGALQHVELVVGRTTGECSMAELVARGSGADPQAAVAHADVHILRFSAGTTGRPKGIAHSNWGWRQMADEVCLSLGRLTEADVQVVCGPMSHASGLLFWPMIARGATQVLCPAFDAGEVLRLLEAERATTVLLVPTMMQLLAAHPDAGTRDLSHLRHVLYTASPASERTLEDAAALFGPVLHQFYGQSEILPLTVLRPDEHVFSGDRRRWLRSAGRPSPNAFIRIVDDEGHDVPAGEIGEVAGRSPGGMLGLWQDPQGTAARTLPGGWIRTRDLGRVEDDGFLYLADRKEDMIISGGYNIWPAEIENALHAHPAVAEAVVVGVPHPKWGETPHAAVVVRPGAAVTEAELIDWCRSALGAVKKPTTVEFRSGPLPKTPIGKVLRREIRDPFWEQRPAGIGGA
jgi:acyl-CoA synthetase (AMP-forming)/AMP-acid ligase II